MQISTQTVDLILLAAFFIFLAYLGFLRIVQERIKERKEKEAVTRFLDSVQTDHIDISSADYLE
jgi:hypothetical protein